LIVFIRPEIISYAEILRTREAAAIGTTNKYLDQVPMGQHSVHPLPAVDCPVDPQQQPHQYHQHSQQETQWEEVPAIPDSARRPNTVEEASAGLRLAAQRGGGTYEPSGRPTWQQSTGGTASLQAPPAQPSTNPHSTINSRSVANGVAAAGPSVRTASAVEYRRLPPVDTAPFNLSGSNPSGAQPPWQSGSERTNFNPPAEQVTSPRDAPLPGTPANSSATPPTVLMPESESNNPLRTKGYRVDETDEIRSASWINNVFRY